MRVCSLCAGIKNPASAATETGRNSSSVAAQSEGYLSAEDQANHFDADLTAAEPVVAYVSSGFIYQVDENLNVVAYGRLIRSEGWA